MVVFADSVAKGARKLHSLDEMRARAADINRWRPTVYTSWYNCWYVQIVIPLKLLLLLQNKVVAAERHIRDSPLQRSSLNSRRKSNFVVSSFAGLAAGLGRQLERFWKVARWSG
jgi:hypothetical protein